MIRDNMKTFETYESVDGLRPCMKRPITVHAKQINEEFRVNTLEGDYKQGKAGDYLMMGVDGELYICDKVIFAKTYNFTDVPNDEGLWTPWGYIPK